MFHPGRLVRKSLAVAGVLLCLLAGPGRAGLWRISRIRITAESRHRTPRAGAWPPTTRGT